MARVKGFGLRAPPGRPRFTFDTAAPIAVDRIYIMIGGELPAQFLARLGVEVAVKFGTA